MRWWKRRPVRVFDARLAPRDIRGSIAHARMLGQCGIIPRARKNVATHQIARYADGAFVRSLEDAHQYRTAWSTHRRRLKRLHTGRSRNDQIRWTSASGCAIR